METLPPSPQGDKVNFTGDQIRLSITSMNINYLYTQRGIKALDSRGPVRDLKGENVPGFICVSMALQEGHVWLQFPPVLSWPV